MQEIKKRRPKGAGNLGPKALKTLKEAYGDYALPIQQRRCDGLGLEHRISDLVNQAYGLIPNPTCLPPVSAGEETSPLRFAGLGIGVIRLGFSITPEDIDLMWKTAPPRMPFSRP